MKAVKFIKKHYETIFLLLINIAVFVYIALAFAAPILKHYGYNNISNIIYFLYSFVCHQKPERSFFILGEQMAFCSRDTFLFLGLQIVSILALFKITLKINIKNWILLVLALPMILDGSIQLIAEVISIATNASPFYESTNILRSITGIFFGFSVGWFFYKKLKE